MKQTPFDIRVYAQHKPLTVEKVTVTYEGGVTRMQIEATATWALGSDNVPTTKRKITKTATARCTDP